MKKNINPEIPQRCTEVTRRMHLPLHSALLRPDLIEGCEDLTQRRREAQRGAEGSFTLRFSAFLCTAIPRFDRRLRRFNAEGAEVRREAQRVLLLCVSLRFLCVS
ncbi:MAG: hypothetical protein WCL11_29420, partial [Verrucomicrobiota bacterium]